jgi:hypothetical protein
MATQREKDVKDWTEKEKEEYCEWCFYHSGGYCYGCVLFKGKIPDEVKNAKR